MAMAVELARGPLPLPVALDERLERAHQLAAVGPLALFDRGEDRVAEQAQRLVLLQREQELEGSEVLVGGDRAAAGRAVAPGQRARLERAAGLVERAARLAGRHRAPGAAGEVRSDVARDARAQALGDGEQLVLAGARARRAEQRAGEAPACRDQA